MRLVVTQAAGGPQGQAEYKAAQSYCRQSGMVPGTENRQVRRQRLYCIEAGVTKSIIAVL